MPVAEPRRRHMRRTALIFGTGLALLVGAAALWAGSALFLQQPRSFPTADIGGPFRLQASNGGTISSADLKGTPFLIFFGFTRCPDVCPTTLAEMSELIGGLRAEGKPIKACFVTIDPERDNTATMVDYLSSFGDTVTGLSGTPDEIAAIEQAYRVYAEKVPLADGDYTMNHTASVYVMGRDGKLQSTFSTDEGREIELAKIRRAWSL